MIRRKFAIALSLVLVGIAVVQDGRSGFARAQGSQNVFQRMADGTRRLVSLDAVVQKRRQALARARPLLLQHRVPIDTGALASLNWRDELRPVLASLPEMYAQDSRNELDGVVMANELRLGEFTELKGDTIIIVNRLVFEGQSPVIRGNHDVYILVVDSVLAGASFDQRFGRQVRTIDTSGRGRPAPQRPRAAALVDEPRGGPSADEGGANTASWAAPVAKRVRMVRSQGGSSGSDGADGTQPGARDEGEEGSAGSQGDCSQSNPNGATGGEGGLGQDGLHGGEGGSGQQGGMGATSI